MIIRELGRGDQTVQNRTTFIQTPNSWEAGIMSALGITQWASDKGRGWENAVQNAAFACAVRLVSESIGAMTARVYTGDALDAQPVYDAPQARLFQDPAPSSGLSSFDFWSDTAAAVETSSAAFIWKVFDTTRSGLKEVVELWPLDPDFFQIRGTPHQRQVFGWQEGKRIDVTPNVIVVRAWNAKPAVDGTSTPELHNSLFARARSYDDYTGRWFDNDGSVSQVIENAPGARDQRQEMAKGWAAMYAGHRNKGRVGMLWGGATLKQFAPTLNDAQATAIATAIAMDIARAMRIYPAALLYAETAPVREATLEMIRGQFLTFSLMHRMRRIERAISADRDLFPDAAQYARFDYTQFSRADLATLGPIVHAMTQTGTTNKDEERSLVLGLPAIPGGAGKTYVVDPVGGVPNNTFKAGGPQDAPANVTPGQGGPVPEN